MCPISDKYIHFHEVHGGSAENETNVANKLAHSTLNIGNILSRIELLPSWTDAWSMRPVPVQPRSPAARPRDRRADDIEGICYDLWLKTKPKTIWKQSWYDKWSIWYRLFNSFDKNGFRRVGFYSQIKKFIPYIYTPVADANLTRFPLTFGTCKKRLCLV